MNNSQKRMLLVVLVVAPLSVSNYFAQDLTSTSGPNVFIFKRPAGSGSAIKPVYRKEKSLPVRKAKGPVSATSNPTDIKKTDLPANAQLGVTLWRLRPERSGDTGAARLLTMKGSSNGSAKMVADRVKLDTVFQKGEKVRLSVESPDSGYLYIVDREMRTDGSLGDSYLIFPTLTTHGGDNQVKAGKPIEIPAQTDDPIYFDITPTEANYAGELLTFMVSPTKIEGLKLTDGPLKLSAGLVDKWENLWEGKSTTLELDEKGRPLTYTEEEKEAGTGTRLLTQKSPAPQTLITVDAAKGKPFLVSVPMKVSKQ